MSFWPRICPVCRHELPPRGNRRLYIPWLCGYRLVHAGACSETVEAQGVLELHPPKRPAALVAVWAARYRAALAAYPVQLTGEPLDRHLATLRLLEPVAAEQLVREEDIQRARQRRKETLEAAKRFVLHAREVWPQARTEVVA